MNEIKILDVGYIRVVETWGSDQSIIEAARMSTQKGFLGWGPKHRKDCPNESNVYDCTCAEPGDEKLLAYLYKNKHMTPFEMGGAILEVKAPIFVFREWHRHRTQSFNEMSARYVPLPNENYFPTVERLMLPQGSNKQAQAHGSGALTHDEAENFLAQLSEVYDAAEGLYQGALLNGVPKELARVCLPVGRYSVMRASANLRNWLAFLTLREHHAAQWEIRQYANALHELLKPVFPRTFELFEAP